MGAQGLGEQAAAGADRGEGGGGALRDQRDAPAAYLAGESPLAAAQQIDPAVQLCPAGDGGVAGQQAEQGVGEHGFAAAGLADHGEQLAGLDGQGEVGDGVHDGVA